jgi:hypothetical protein
MVERWAELEATADGGARRASENSRFYGPATAERNVRLFR